MKKFLTLVLAVLTMMAVSSVAHAAPVKPSDGPVYSASGDIVGYNYGGLYWSADEYEQCMCTVDTRAYVLTHSSPVEATAAKLSYGVEMSPDEIESIQTDVEGITNRLGMPIAMKETEDGTTILLGGYTFKCAEGTDAGSLMRMLEDFDFARSLYKDMFFSPDWVYATEKVNGETNITVDVENKTVTFGVRETIDEIELVDILTALRTAVLSGK